MNKTIKLVLLFSGLLLWSAMIFIGNKKRNVPLAAGSGILLGATLSTLLRDFGQKRKRKKRLGNPYF
jgi:hypothetical protein